MNKYRKYLIGTVGILIFLSVTSLVATQARGAASAISVVYPTGVFPDDVQNVQAAISSGGTVLLKVVNAAGQFTAFNFGTPEFLPGRRVLLTTDVNIIGERAGSHMTTIQGGLTPFRCLVPVRSRIQTIDFEGPLSRAILITASTHAEIIDNRINGVVPLVDGSVSFADGVLVLGADENAITGELRIADNVINEPSGDISYAVRVEDVVATSQINQNRINCNRIGIFVARTHRTMAIENNQVTATPGPSEETVGIYVDGDPEAAYLVRGNTVLCDGLFPDGLIIAGVFSRGTRGAIVERNHILMHHSMFGAISLYGQVSRAGISENSIEGDSAYAIQVTQGFDPAGLATFNQFRMNNISGFHSSVADVFFDINARNNTYLGQCASVINLGVNNRINCDLPVEAPGDQEPSPGR